MKTEDSTGRARVLMLAGGSARRFGRDKRQEPLNTGFKLVEESARCYLAAGFQVCVCLSAREEDRRLALDLETIGAASVFCDRSVYGMGDTLAQGAQANQRSAGLLIALADMPAISVDTLHRLQQHAADDRIVYPRLNGRRGHPVWFGARFVPQLCALSGDEGAAAILRTHADACIAVDVDDPGVLMDADTPSELEAVDRYLQSRSSTGVSG